MDCFKLAQASSKRMCFELAEASSKRMCFELAQASSMRMCPEIEKKFPDFHGRQLELMMYLCLVAYKSEIDDGLCDDAWLRTTITLKDDHVDADSLQQADVFFHSDSSEISLMAKLFKDTPMCQSSWEQVERHQCTLTSRIEIRWNILPRRAYWERLQKLQSQLNWTRVQSSLLWRTPCFSSSSREFIPITVIDQARQRRSSLKEKVDEWRKNGGRCDLAAQLQSSVVRPTAQMASPRNIKYTDVVSMKKLGNDTATVYKVSWKNGIYAMKSFENLFVDMRLTERYIAMTVLHPHIIRGFGHYEENGKSRLLMEMLDTNLTRHAVEKCRVGVEPPFSREDTFDVLLQIASAVKHMHLHGVVHGDLKPDNIVLSSFEILGNGRHFLAKVADFGDAQFIVSKEPFKPGGGGTTRFAAPELLEWRKNREKVFSHPKSIDVYSFGGVAHELLTGYEAYPELTNDELLSDFIRGVIAGTLKPSGSDKWRNSGMKRRFPVDLIKLVEKCWEVLPEDRPSFSYICEELERCKSLEDRAAERLKVFAMVSLFAFIWVSSLTTEKSAVDPFKFIALTLFIFIVMSYLCRVIRCVVCKFRDVVFPMKVKVL